jgi:hypothetical protein
LVIEKTSMIKFNVLGVDRMPFLRTQRKTEFSDEFTKK